MRKKIPILFCLAFFFSSCAQPKHAPTIRFPYQWLDVQGFGGDIDKQQIPEPSGLCYHPLRKTLFVVSDEGFVFEIQRNGAPKSNWEIKGDLEGITVDPRTGLLYIAVEGEDSILEFDPDEGRVKRKFPINREFGGDPNFLQKQRESYDNGIESIAFIPDRNHPEGGTFYVGNQWDPPCLMEVLVPLQSARSEEAEARIVRVLPFRMDDPAGMYYDFRTRRLNIVSDADNILVEVTLEGKLIKEYAFLGDNQEGICLDEDGYLYIAQDTGGILRVKDLRKR